MGVDRYRETPFGEDSVIAQLSLVKKDGRPIPPHELERVREPFLQELAQFGRRLKLWDRFQFLEG
jgi:hypothetical protein